MIRCDRHILLKGCVICVARSISLSLSCFWLIPSFHTPLPHLINHISGMYLDAHRTYITHMTLSTSFKKYMNIMCIYIYTYVCIVKYNVINLIHIHVYKPSSPNQFLWVVAIIPNGRFMALGHWVSHDVPAGGRVVQFHVLSNGRSKW